MMNNVSRETISRLHIYKSLLIKWQSKFNLVSRKSIEFVWERHFEDSLQLLKYINPEAKSLIDLGAGAGFPGMVLAIALSETNANLIESDTNKCTFLENVSRETMAPVKVINKRIEETKDLKGEIITARALAPLSQLLDYSKPLMNRGAVLLFHKGMSVQQEIDEAQKKWNFELEIFPSLTDSTGSILLIKNLEREPSDG